ncbi:MAG: hypothetical protein H7Y42_12140 [Chitinophagaceae bacterium]|nr:hypothetical protein [Chitinophagaceae bacterium]
MKITSSLAFILSILIILISCSKGGSGNNPTACDGVANKAYAADVAPLIQTFCNQSACHNAGSTNGPGPLTNYAEVFNARSNIRGQVQAGLMPQNSTLTTAQRNTIICWIDAGAPNN